MTDKIIISRKEIEAFLDGIIGWYEDDLRALLDKAEVVSCEPICNLWVCPATLYYKVDRGEHHNSELIPVYTSPQPSRIAELEAEIARLKAITLMLLKSPSYGAVLVEVNQKENELR